MSKELIVSSLTNEQINLIKATVAKNATNDELNLFLYRCKNMGLDPLKPGQIHFIKYGSGPGTIVIGIDGFRSKAASTGKHTGTMRGVIRGKDGECIGAWCEVYRSDWSKCAREEVSLSEYSTGKNQWAKMPETMIKKVAEVAALRMAFPDDLGGIYSDDEMEQANNPAGSGGVPLISLKESLPQQGTIPQQSLVDKVMAARPSVQQSPIIESLLNDPEPPEPPHFDAHEKVDEYENENNVYKVPEEKKEVFDPGDFILPFKKGKNAGKKLKDISDNDLKSTLIFCDEKGLANVATRIREYFNSKDEMPF